MASVSSRIFAITGGASGIGAATCRLLATRGADVLCVADISDIHFEDLAQAIKNINPSTKLRCTVLDVSSSHDVDQWMSSIILEFGDLHGAANIAGVAQEAEIRGSPTILEETDDEWRRIIQVNLDGVFYCMRAQVRVMKSLEATDRSIVNVGSIAAFYHLPDTYAYNTSKAALAYLTTCTATDTFFFGIRINTVSPGITKTPLLKGLSSKTLQEIKELCIKEGYNLIEPEDVARTIVWLLSGDSRPVHGSNICVGACPP